MKVMRGFTSDGVFKVIVIVILLFIVYFIYQSWVAISTFTMLAENPESIESDKELSDYIDDYNDLFKKLLDLFI